VPRDACCSSSPASTPRPAPISEPAIRAARGAVRFATERRIHAALPVRDLRRSIAFYRALFDREPTKLRQGYARFELDEPPMNLALRETDGPTDPVDEVAHFGVQWQDVAAVRREAERLARAGLATRREDAVICCYALQDKVWVTDPDGNRWETYVVLDDDAPCCVAHGCDRGTTGSAATPEDARGCCSGPGR
jgi:catechol 2,3-dioxygenase-like lactoylglutathione lyase family enzyme